MIARYPNDKLVYLDEAGFNQHATRNYGYAPANEPAYVNVPGNKGNSVMAVIDNQG